MGGRILDSKIANVFQLSLRCRQATGISYSVTLLHDQDRKARAGHGAPTTIDNLVWGGESLGADQVARTPITVSLSTESRLRRAFH